MSATPPESQAGSPPASLEQLSTTSLFEEIIRNFDGGSGGDVEYVLNDSVDTTILQSSLTEYHLRYVIHKFPMLQMHVNT